MNPCLIYKTLDGEEPADDLSLMLEKHRGAEYPDLYLFVTQPDHNIDGHVHIDLTETIEEDFIAAFDAIGRTDKCIHITQHQGRLIIDHLYPVEANEIKTPELI